MQPPAQRLGLGTVQFGLDYGIVNAQGQVSTEDAHAIMRQAGQDGVTLLDTAALYGSSEQVVGELLADSQDFRVVTKTVKWDADQGEHANIERITKHIDRSLERLRVPRIAGLLLHNADDLLVGGDALWDALTARRPHIERIGYSLYHPAQLDALLERGYVPDLIQIPANAFDQRFVNHKGFQELDRSHTEVHVRSCFLQGTLLHAPEQLPKSFAPLREHITVWRRWLDRHGLTPLQGALGYGLSTQAFDHVIVGVQDLSQWTQIMETVRSLDLNAELPWSECALRDTHWIDPSQWPPRS